MPFLPAFVPSNVKSIAFAIANFMSVFSESLGFTPLVATKPLTPKPIPVALKEIGMILFGIGISTATSTKAVVGVSFKLSK